jgi:hypothetical protein
MGYTTLYGYVFYSIDVQNVAKIYFFWRKKLYISCVILICYDLVNLCVLNDQSESFFCLVQERLKSSRLLSDQKKLDEARSLQTVMRDSKQCPRCKIAISKIEGCNKMTCSNCGQYFCYQCKSAIAGYDHFSYR